MSKPGAAQLTYETTHYVRDRCLCLHVQRAARAVARRFDEALRPLELTNGQFSLLMSLNRPGPAKMAEICSLLAVDRTTLTANLKPLERRGLLRISVDETDRRGRLLTLTEAGRKLLTRAMPIWTRTHEEIDRLVAGSDIDGLRADLRALA